MRYADNTSQADIDAFNKMLTNALTQSTKFANWWSTGTTEPTTGINYDNIAGGSPAPSKNPKAHIIIKLVHGGDFIDSWQGNEDHTTTIMVNLDNLALLPVLTKDRDHWVMPAGSASFALTQVDCKAHFLAEAWSTAITGATTTTLEYNSHANAIRGVQKAVRREFRLPEIDKQTMFSPDKKEFKQDENYQKYKYTDSSGKEVTVPKVTYIQIKTVKGLEWIRCDGGKIETLFLNGSKEQLKTLPGGALSTGRMKHTLRPAAAKPRPEPEPA
jgi:hypothetical protein